MQEYYGCDMHKHYSVFASINEAGHKGDCVRIDHDRNQISRFLQHLPPESPIAIETVGNWYWLVDEIERAGHIPSLVNAGKAKVMMGQINKTDKLDTYGLATLLRNGTIPKVWIPPREIRDQRELLRMRMTLVHIRTTLKNRIHASLAKYAIDIQEVSDIFGSHGREIVTTRLAELPPYTRDCVQSQIEIIDQLNGQINWCEKQIDRLIEQTSAAQLLMSMPGVGPILSTVIAVEIGDINRFPDAEHLASYAGMVPRVHSSGGKTYYGQIRPDINHYLRWAFVEAANVAVANQVRWMNRHVVKLYRRIKARKGSAKAVVAAGRHLSEATFWILHKNEPYREPQVYNPVSSTRK
jgi:transposase